MKLFIIQNVKRYKVKNTGRLVLLFSIVRMNLSESNYFRIFTRFTALKGKGAKFDEHLTIQATQDILIVSSQQIFEREDGKGKP